jgi:hypothetical protein
MQHYVIKLVSDLQHVINILRMDTLVTSTNKTDRHDITEILLKVAVNTIAITSIIQYMSYALKTIYIK